MGAITFLAKKNETYKLGQLPSETKSIEKQR